MTLPSATSTAINSRAVAIAGLSSEIRGVRPVEFLLHVAQRLEHRGLSPEVDGSSPSVQELVGGLRSGLKNRVNASPARQFPSVAITDGSAPNEARMRRVSHRIPGVTSSHRRGDRRDSFSTSTPEIRV